MSNQKEAAGKGQKGIIIAVIAVLLVALAACVFLLLSGKKGSEEETTTPASALDRGVIEKDNVDEIMSEMGEQLEEGMFECKMSLDWTFLDGDSEAADAYVANSENNTYTLYFDVYDESTDELLYSSPLLPVGTDISGIKLDKKLAAGMYNGLVMYTMVDENNEEVSSVGFRITISVLN